MIERICPECGKVFELPEHRRNADQQRFCVPAHKARFYNLMNKRGRSAMALFHTAARGRHKASDVATYARRTLYALESEWRQEDAAAGRNPALVIEEKMRLGWIAGDLPSNRGKHRGRVGGAPSGAQADGAGRSGDTTRRYGP